jgi:hypothetical protein
MLSVAAMAEGAGLSRFFADYAGGGGKKKDRPSLSFLSNDRF